MTEELDLDQLIEVGFDNFMEDFEIDQEASLLDLLYELYAEGYYLALEHMEEFEGEEEDSEVPVEGS